MLGNVRNIEDLREKLGYQIDPKYWALKDKIRVDKTLMVVQISAQEWNTEAKIPC